MQSDEIRKRFLAFFEKRGHAIVPSASLVPENDPSVLFNTAGMQPFVPYLMGEPHPKGKRIANVQKCVRTNDIEEVGDKTHLTFFEMLGNWSLGDYFKEDAIKWSYEFLTSKDEGLGLDPEKLYITCFAGNDDAPKDTESAEIWVSLGIPEHRIYFRDSKDNWWSPGDNGPCGPSSEMFYDISNGVLGDLSPEEFADADDRQDVVEVWNDVFMEYEKKDGKVVGKLAQKNVDTGAGFERVVAVTQGVDNPYDTDLFQPIMAFLPQGDEKARRIIADHIRASTFLISDGITPAKTDRGYILRRLIRRSVRYADILGFPVEELEKVIQAVIDKYEKAYPALKENDVKIKSEISKEVEKFKAGLKTGVELINMKIERGEFENGIIPGHTIFWLVTTHGIPYEVIEEIAKEKGLTIDKKGFETELRIHKETSRAGAEQKFKGGLADTSETTTALHTATHLMLAGLRKYLGDHVHQAGSNITAERTRFDFTHPEKVSREVLDQVEAYVNEAIQKKCEVVIEQMPKEEAQARGVEGSFWEKYPDMVNVYMVKCGDGTIYSQELCGGPHVTNTGDIKGTFTIKKEEASSAGVRRVKAVLE